MVAMLRISDDCLCFEGCERHGNVVSPFPEMSAHPYAIKPSM
jgi:hypothetical protein